MKKAILGLIAVFLIATVSAIEFPQPITGIIQSDNVAYQDVRITNGRTGVTETVKTNSGGEYSVEWSNTDDKGGTITRTSKGDQFKIEVLGCVDISDKCTQVITFIDQPEIFVLWDLNDLTLKCGSCPTCSSGGSSGGGGGTAIIYKSTQELCDADFPCSSTQGDVCDSASCPDDITPYANCNSCCALGDGEEKDCPPEVVCVDKDNGLLAYILGIIGVIGGATSTYYFKRKDAKLPNGTFVYFGGVGPRHLHRGIRGKHDPNTSHREAHERHPKGQLDPKYEKDATGVYTYVGGK